MTFDDIERTLGHTAVNRLQEATEQVFIAARSSADPAIGDEALRELLIALAVSVLVTPSNYADADVRADAFAQRLKQIANETQALHRKQDLKRRQ